MKKFFESKQNRVVVAVAAAVIVLLTAVLVTVAVTRKRKTYEQAATEPQVETQTEAPTVAESESETATEPQTAESAPETSAKSTGTADKSSAKSDKGKSDKDKSDNSGNKDKKPVIYNLGEIRLEGRWGTTESIAPSELFDGEFLAKTGFNKQLRVSTIYQFDSKKNFSITYEILSSNDYVAAMREAYTAYFKEIYPEWTPEELEKRADQTAWYEFWDICEAVIGVRYDAAEVTGTYSNDETTITYQCDGGWSFSESYVIKDKTLTLTGSSEGNDGYPITLTRR